MELQPVFTITGREDVKAMINASPEVFRRYYRAVLNAGGAYFIGRKKGAGPKRGQFTGDGSRAKSREWKSRFVDSAKHGLIRSQLAEKRTALGKNWSDAFINGAMQYRIENPDRLEMSLKAGTLYTNKKRIHGVMEFLEQGGTFHSNKYMPIPIYENFTSKLDQFKGYKGVLAKLIRDKRVSIVNKNGKLYYIDKITDQILAVGMKSVTIRKQFEFYGKWSQAYLRIMHDLEQATQNAARDVVEFN